MVRPLVTVPVSVLEALQWVSKPTSGRTGDHRRTLTPSEPAASVKWPRWPGHLDVRRGHFSGRLQLTQMVWPLGDGGDVALERAAFVRLPATARAAIGEHPWQPSVSLNASPSSVYSTDSDSSAIGFAHLLMGRTHRRKLSEESVAQSTASLRLSRPHRLPTRPRPGRPHVGIAIVGVRHGLYRDPPRHCGCSRRCLSLAIPVGKNGRN